MTKANLKRVVAGILSIALFVAYWIISGRVHDGVKSDTRFLAAKHVESGIKSRVNGYSAAKPAAVTDEASTAVIRAREDLRSLEMNRITFFGEHGDEEKSQYNFLLKLPTADERSKMSRLCASVGGLSTEWFEGRLVTWSQKLRDEYVFEPRFEYVNVCVEWNKGSTEGRYSILGIEPGKLSYLENGSPASSDGRMHIIVVGKPFDANKDWRFSHLLPSHD